MRLLICLAASVLVFSSPGRAAADPDLVIVTVEDAPVAVEEIEAILRGELPDLHVTTETSDAAGVARVTIAAGADGRLAVRYRDAAGRETVRLVEPGPQPASTVAMVVVNLQEDQLDAVLGPPAPRSGRTAATPRPEPRVRAAVQPAPARPEAASLGAGLGLMSRHLEVEVTGAPSNRNYQALYPVLAADARVYPARLFGAAGPMSWVGLELAFRRAFALQTNGVTSEGQPIEVDSAYQDLAASVLFDVPLSAGPSGTQVRFAAGWSQVSFALDAAQMSLLDESVWTPSFEYVGATLAAGLTVPLGAGSLRAHAGASFHWVTDVGPQVRDLYGSDTTGATGYGVQAGLGGAIVPRLLWSTTIELRQFETEMSGVTSEAGGTVGAFPSASDRYLAARLALAYAP